MQLGLLHFKKISSFHTQHGTNHVSYMSNPQTIDQLLCERVLLSLVDEVAALCINHIGSGDHDTGDIMAESCS